MTRVIKLRVETNFEGCHAVSSSMSMSVAVGTSVGGALKLSPSEKTLFISNLSFKLFLYCHCLYCLLLITIFVLTRSAAHERVRAVASCMRNCKIASRNL